MMAPLKTVTSLSTLYKRKIDLLTEEIAWEFYEELDAMVDRLYEGDKRQLEEYKLIRKSIFQLYDDMKALEVLYKNHPIYHHNWEIIYLCSVVVIGGDMTIEGLD